MTFINFPSSPVLNQEFLAGTRKWIWNGVYWQAVSPTDRVGYTGSRGEGYTGSEGIGQSSGIPYNYSTDTTSVSVSTGTFRFNSTITTSVTALYISPVSQDLIDFTGFIETWSNSTTPGNKGTLFFKPLNMADSSVTNIWKVTNTVTNNAGYLQVPVEWIYGSMFQDTDQTVVEFYRTGDGGTDGFEGPTGYTGSRGIDGSIGYTGSQGAGFTGSASNVPGYTGSEGDGFTGSQGYTGSQGESSFVYDNLPPANPQPGDRWFDSDIGAELVWTFDGDSGQWVEVSASGYIGYTGSAGKQVTFNTLIYVGNGTEQNFAVSTGTTVNSSIVFKGNNIQTPVIDYAVTGTNLFFATAPGDGIAVQIREFIYGEPESFDSGVTKPVATALALVLGF